MHAKKEKNRIEFLLDGIDFFPRLYQMMKEVETASPANNTYLRLAFWWAERNFTVGAAPVPVKLNAALKAVADKGHSVDVILWCPARLDLVFGEELSKANYDSHTAFKNELDGYQGPGIKVATSSGSKTIKGKIRVYLEVYGGWNGSSTHQKIAISSVAGKLKALAGGLNLADAYWADKAHHLSAWHDTGILVEGPSAVDIDCEWARRWNKQNTQIPLIGGNVFTSPPLTGKVSDQPEETTKPVTVDIRTTNSESFIRETDIQERLIEEIGKANSYIYFENYTFFDPSLVRALYDRLQKSNPPKVIIVIPKPGNSLQSYLDYIAFAKIALADCTSISDASGEIKRSDCSKFELSESYNPWNKLRSITSTFNNRWMEDDGVNYIKTGATDSKVIKFKDFTAINGGQRFYYVSNSVFQSIYTHSKLALFDDKAAMVGSSNFNFRSMVYDGELSVFVDGNDTVVSEIRQAVFSHFNMRDAANWDTDVTTPQTGSDMRVHKLSLTDFPVRDVTSLSSGVVKDWLNFTWF